MLHRVHAGLSSDVPTGILPRFFSEIPPEIHSENPPEVYHGIPSGVSVEIPRRDYSDNNSGNLTEITRRKLQG